MSLPTPRGFVIDRGDGRAQLPGSLHTNRRLAQWLSLAEPGRVRVRIGKVELGQGILTAMQLLVAEELDLPLQAVQVLPASTDHGPDEGMTSGSLSVQDCGAALRHACAELRGLAGLRAAERTSAAAGGSAALEWLPGGVCRVAGREVGDYWSLLEDHDLDVEFSGRWSPKPAAQRRLLGRARAPRVDLPDKVYGRARFIHDLQLPGMLHGRVLRPPSLTAALDADPAGLFEALPPGVRAWADGRFVAVVAATEHQAEEAAGQLRARLRWRAGAPLPAASAMAAFLRAAPCETTRTACRGEPGEPAGPGLFQAEYLKPYLAHASLAPSCALACWDGRRLEVWTHSQGIHNLRDDLVLALSGDEVPVPKEAITVHHVEGAGCYGHNGADDVAFDAVLMARACPGQPVRVRWSREDEMVHSPLGPAQLVSLQARLDAEGRITHWWHDTWSSGFSSRPGRARVPTLLAASQRARATALPLPINPPLAAGGGTERNAVPGYDFENLQVHTHRLTVMPLRTSAMRALGGYANVYAIESFMDELAHARGECPLSFRLRHLRDPRAVDVLREVTSRSPVWERRARTAGTPGASAEVGPGEALGCGLAWARYKNTGAWCAVVAEVAVSDRVRVLALDVAADVGMVVDLDGVINQLEGGAVQSTSWTLKEAVTQEADRVTSTSWETYPILRFSEVPEVRVHLLDRPEEAPLGAGEAAQGPVAAAIANAVHDALGVRVRELPLTPERLLRAVHAAETGR